MSFLVLSELALRSSALSFHLSDHLEPRPFRRAALLRTRRLELYLESQASLYFDDQIPLFSFGTEYRHFYRVKSRTQTTKLFQAFSHFSLSLPQYFRTRSEFQTCLTTRSPNYNHFFRVRLSFFKDSFYIFPNVLKAQKGF